MAKKKTSGRLLSAADIDTAHDLDFEIVDVPEWGGEVKVQSLPADIALRFSEEVNLPDIDKKQLFIRLLAMSLVDDAGTRLYTDEQVEKLARKNLKVLMRLSKTAMALNGFGDAARALAEAKNASSETAAADVSLTDSRPN
jgi:hypothetical protein